MIFREVLTPLVFSVSEIPLGVAKVKLLTFFGNCFTITGIASQIMRRQNITYIERIEYLKYFSQNDKGFKNIKSLLLSKYFHDGSQVN